MNIIWTLLLLVMSMGNGGVQPAADQAAGNGRPESILPAVVQTMAANLAAGRIDDPLTPAEVKAASLGRRPK